MLRREVIFQRFRRFPEALEQLAFLWRALEALEQLTFLRSPLEG